MMRAYQCNQWGGPEVLMLDEVPMPACGPGQALIQVRAWGVNATDLVLIGGHYHQKPPFPFIPGMEVAGEIVEVGADVSHVKVGDRVAYIGPNGYAEYVAADAGGLFVLPDGMAWAEAASFLSCYCTAYVGVVHRGQLRSGERLLITGAAGGTGLAAVAIARRLGARVIAAGSTAEKLALARRFGADEGINYTNEDLVERVRALTDGRGADVIYETVGGGTFEQTLHCIAFEGRLVTIGFASMQFPQIPAEVVLFGGFSIVGSSLYATVQHRPEIVGEMYAALAGWHSEKALPSLVTKELPFAQAPQALALLANRSVAGRISLIG